MLKELPLDLITTIIEEFIVACEVAKHLSALDVACCNHSTRAELLGLLARVRCKSPEPFPELAPLFVNFVMWIGRRSVKLSQFVLNTGLDLQVVTGLLATCPTVQQVRIGSCSQYGNRLAPFLDCFPSLSQALLFDIIGQQFPYIANRNLRVLHLTGLTSYHGYERFNPLVFITVLVSLRGTLQELSCDGLNNDALKAVAELCQLKRFAADFGRIGKSEFVQALSKLGLHLEELEIADKGWNRGHLRDVIHQVLPSCPRLQKISVKTPDMLSDTTAFLSAVIVNCPCIERVNVDGSDGGEFTATSNGADGRRMYYKAKFGAYCDSADAKAVYSVLSFGSILFHNRCRASHDWLQCMADISGTRLEVIDLSLDGKMKDRHLTYFFTHCPNLICVCLDCESADIASSASNCMSQIFALCPRISTFRLTGCSLIDDDSFLQALTGCPSSCLQRLYIDKFLSSKSVLRKALKKIIKCFPSLNWLTAYAPPDPNFQLGMAYFGDSTDDALPPWVAATIVAAGLTFVPHQDWRKLCQYHGIM